MKTYAPRIQAVTSSARRFLFVTAIKAHVTERINHGFQLKGLLSPGRGYGMGFISTFAPALRVLSYPIQGRTVNGRYGRESQRTMTRTV
jgi:hypothetical protein